MTQKREDCRSSSVRHAAKSDEALIAEIERVASRPGDFYLDMFISDVEAIPTAEANEMDNVRAAADEALAGNLDFFDKKATLELAVQRAAMKPWSRPLVEAALADRLRYVYVRSHPDFDERRRDCLCRLFCLLWY